MLLWAHTMERVGVCSGETAFPSSRAAMNWLQLVAKHHSEVATKCDIYLVRLHAAFANTSTVGFCASLGFFFSLDGVTFFMCGGLLFFLCSNKGGRWHFNQSDCQMSAFGWVLGDTCRTENYSVVLKLKL